MLEDPRMDKKSNNRSSQTQSRASAVDCKKSSESAHKPLPRFNKKREGPASTPKNEPYRKNVPAQRGRGQVDRRPRARGSSGYAMGGTENTGIAEDEPELGSLFVPGSKKQNLNHLLNFMYTPRGERGPERRGPGPGLRRYMPHRATHPHNHALYLQAWCQFVVKEDGEYKANLLDPDVPIKWESIEEIVVRSTGKSECPICLGSPAAGRVGQCGHVHCWPCALHYAEAHDKQPPPCPVCAAPFRVHQMKPARILQWEASNDEVTMRLVRRLRGSTVVEAAPPRGQAGAAASACVGAEVLPLARINDAPYCKLFSANKQQVIDILERERKELQEQILAEIDTTEIVYIEQALETLKKQEENIKNQVNIPKDLSEEPKVDNAPTVYEKQPANTNRIDWFDEDEGAACMESIQEHLADIAIADATTEVSNLNPEAAEFELKDFEDNQAEEFPLIESTPPPENEPTIGGNWLSDIDKENQLKYFYFYQADDGQQVFLNSLNVRLLTASWGALAAAPPVISGRVLHRDTLSLVEQTRKHMPYAAHLPLHCPFDIVELDLQPPYVTTSALDNYAGELERRARARARSERDERRRERAYRRATEGPPRPDISSELLFPPTSPPLHPSPPDLLPPPPADDPPGTVIASPTGLSFAKMASTSGTWRVRAPQPPRPLWRVRAPQPPRPLSLPAVPRAPGLFLSDAIEAALHAAPAPAASAKKNKRAKQKVLFATGMQRAG